MNRESKRRNVEIAAAWLRENGYDLWLSATRERSDPAIHALFGSVVVGTGLYVVTAAGKSYLIANRIDIQEGRDSGVFDEAIPYAGNFDEVVQAFFAEKIGAGKLMCINYSPDCARKDGMRLGLWKKLLKLLPPDYDFRSSETLYSQLNEEDD